MTEEYKSVLKLVVDGFKRSAAEAKRAVDDVKGALNSTKQDKAFDGAADGAKKAAAEVKKVGNEVRKANESIRDAGKAAYSSNGGFSAMKKGLNETSMAAKSLMASLGKFVSLAGIVASIKAAISAASSSLAEEAQFAQVFGEYQNQAREALKGIAGQAGSTSDAMRSSFSSIASFARVSGMDTGNALSLTERAMRAAADSAAFYDRELSEVTENLRSFLKGNFENDAALGLSSTEFTRNAMAMQLYGQKFIELTEEQKQWTLLAQIEQANQLSGALGQAARESGNWTTQIQKLKAQFKSLLSVVGRGFIAALTPILNFVNIALGALVEFANGVSRVFSMVFGSAQTAMTATAGSVDTSGLSDALGDVENAAAGATDGVDGVGKAAKGAASAAKELARSVMGFDKINKLTAQASGSSGGSGGGDGGGSAAGTGAGVSGGLSQAAGASVVGDVIAQTEKLSAAMQALKEWLSGLNFTPLKESWDKLTEAGGRLAAVIKDGLQWGLENVLAPLAKWYIEEAAPRNVELLANAVNILADALIILKPAFQWVWDNVLQPLAKLAANAYTAALDALNAALEDVDGALRDIIDVMEGRASLGELFSKWFTVPNITDFTTDMTNLVTKTNDFVKLVSDPVHLSVTLAKIGWSTVADWVKENLGDKVEAVVTFVKEKGQSLGELIGTATEAVVTFVKKKGQSLGDLIGTATEAVVTFIKKKGQSLKDLIGDATSAVVSFTKKSGQDLKDLIGSSTTAVVNFVKKKGQSLGDLIGSSFNVAIKLVKGWKGTVAKALGLSNLWTKFRIKLPKVQVTWSGKPIKLPHFNLKWNAKGGILNGATIFGMAGNTLLGGGEAGREAVLPLDSNTGWMDKIADRVAQRVGSSSGSNQPIVVKVVLDGRVVAESTVREWRSQARQGRYPLSELV